MAPRIPFQFIRLTRVLLRPSSSSHAQTLLPLQRRAYSTKQPSPTSQFYKTFTRPIAKTFLLAVFTYQLVYWAWLKLEMDEIRSDTAATIADLEGKVEEYKKQQQGTDVSKSTK